MEVTLMKRKFLISLTLTSLLLSFSAFADDIRHPNCVLRLDPAVEDSFTAFDNDGRAQISSALSQKGYHLVIGTEQEQQAILNQFQVNDGSEQILLRDKNNGIFELANVKPDGSGNTLQNVTIGPKPANYELSTVLNAYISMIGQFNPCIPTP